MSTLLPTASFGYEELIFFQFIGPPCALSNAITTSTADCRCKATIVDEGIEGSNELADELKKIVLFGQLLSGVDLPVQLSNDLAIVLGHIAVIDDVTLQ
jgi:hypothetical protein